MRTDVHFVCEKCGGDYKDDPSKATLCEANHPTIETFHIREMKDFSNGLDVIHKGTPRELVMGYTDGNDKTWATRYYRSNDHASREVGQ